MITRRKSIPKDDSEIFQQAVKQMKFQKALDIKKLKIKRQSIKTAAEYVPYNPLVNPIIETIRYKRKMQEISRLLIPEPKF
ncbi:putative meiosis-specific with OB domain-containing protein [Sesbania bispinosa]|nr:putative meiosis-specific with OB domain-containing protein [Sesbania bispinosa]